MQLTKAIKHAEKVVINCLVDNPECAENHNQLAMWLIELCDIKDKKI